MRTSLFFVIIGLSISAINGMYGMSSSAKDFFVAQTQEELAEAAANGQIRVVSDLIAHGAKVDFQGVDGMTALIWAFLHHNKQGYEYLLDRGANPNLQLSSSGPMLDSIAVGNSAMSFAAMHEDPWYLQTILKHGGDANIVNPAKRVSVIFPIIKLLNHSHPEPRLEQLKMLIAAGANINARDGDGSTPLMLAAILNRYDMAYVLLEAGADASISTENGSTLIYLMKRIRTNPNSPLYEWRIKVLEFLKAKGFDIIGCA